MDTSRHERHLRFLQTFLAAPLNSPEALHLAIVKAASCLLPTICSRFWRLDPEADEVTMQASFPPADEELLSRIPLSDSISGEALEAGRPNFYNSIADHPKLKNRQFVLRHNLNDLWVVPLFLTDNGNRIPYGALTLYPAAEARGIELGEEEVELFSSLSRIIRQHSPILDHSRLSSSIELGRQPEETTSEFWTRVANGIRQVLGFDSTSVFVNYHSEERLTLVASSGFDTSREHPDAVVRPDLIEYAAGLDAIGYALKDRQTIYSQNVYEESWYQGSHKGTPKYGATFLAAPIWDTSRTTIVGLVRCTGKRRMVTPSGPESINADDIARINFIAKELSPVVQHHIHSEHNRVLWALASHDLKAPANVIRDAAGTIRKSLRKPNDTDLSKARRDLTNIIDSSELLQLLVKMLELGVEDTLIFKYKRTPVLGRSLTKIVAMLRPAALRAGIRLSYSAERFTDFPELWVDQQQIEIAMYNILINAVKYSYKDTEITITWGGARDDPYLQFDNFGFGVPKGDKEAIFRPFVRATNVAPGKGLGLFIVRRIMQAHGGDVELTRASTPTSFILRFPRGLAYGPPADKRTDS